MAAITPVFPIQTAHCVVPALISVTQHSNSFGIERVQGRAAAGRPATSSKAFSLPCPRRFFSFVLCKQSCSFGIHGRLNIDWIRRRLGLGCFNKAVLGSSHPCFPLRPLMILLRWTRRQVTATKFFFGLAVSGIPATIGAV